MYKLVAMPVTEDTLLLYISFLFEEGLVGASICVYLSAVRSLHIFSGERYPIELHRVKLALKGAVRSTAAPIRKLPITFQVLKKILPKVCPRFDGAVLQAVMTLAFFGCLRMGEICVPDSMPFSPVLHVNWGDITLDTADKSLSIFLRRSKTDTNNVGVNVHVGCSGDHLCCAYCSMLKYMHVVESYDFPVDDTSPLFMLPGGRALYKSYITSATKLSLSLAGFPAQNYSGHSFRAGAATTAGDNNFQDWEIKLLGRWVSPAYNLYMRNPKVASTFACRLVS